MVQSSLGRAFTSKERRATKNFNDMSANEATVSRKVDLPAATPAVRPSETLPKEIVDSIAAAITGLEFGSVEITIHNSRVVQIERHERIRFTSNAGR